MGPRPPRLPRVRGVRLQLRPPHRARAHDAALLPGQRPRRELVPVHEPERRLPRHRRVHEPAGGGRRQREPRRRHPAHDGDLRGLQPPQHRLRDSGPGQQRLRGGPGSDCLPRRWPPGRRAMRSPGRRCPVPARYYIYQTEGPNGPDFGKIKIGETTGTTFVTTSLQNGRPYYFSVLPVGSNTSCFGPMSRSGADHPGARPEPRRASGAHLRHLRRRRRRLPRQLRDRRRDLHRRERRHRPAHQRPPGGGGVPHPPGEHPGDHAPRAHRGHAGGLRHRERRVLVRPAGGHAGPDDADPHRRDRGPDLAPGPQPRPHHRAAGAGPRCGGQPHLYVRHQPRRLDGAQRHLDAFGARRAGDAVPRLVDGEHRRAPATRSARPPFASRRIRPSPSGTATRSSPAARPAPTIAPTSGCGTW